MLAINGIVFDVTAGRNFYGPSACLSSSFSVSTFYLLISQLDGMYGNFAGRNASRGMAKQSFDLGIT